MLHSVAYSKLVMKRLPYNRILLQYHEIKGIYVDYNYNIYGDTTMIHGRIHLCLQLDHELHIMGA